LIFPLVGRGRLPASEATISPVEKAQKGERKKMPKKSKEKKLYSRVALGSVDLSSTRKRRGDLGSEGKRETRRSSEETFSS